MDITKDDKKVISAGEDKNILLWDVIKNNPIRNFYGHYGKINKILFNKQENLILSGSNDNTIRLWDIRQSNSKELDLIKLKNPVKKILVTENKIIAGFFKKFC